MSAFPVGGVDKQGASQRNPLWQQRAPCVQLLHTHRQQGYVSHQDTLQTCIERVLVILQQMKAC